MIMLALMLEWKCFFCVQWLVLNCPICPKSMARVMWARDARRCVAISGPSASRFGETPQGVLEICSWVVDGGIAGAMESGFLERPMPVRVARRLNLRT
jgi:hypothetical protein